MSHLSVQCPSGVSGDMLLGALLDLGAPLDIVRTAVDAVSPEPVVIDVERVRRAGLAALKAHVRVEESRQHRGWSTIRGLLEGAGPGLTEGARGRALATFEALAVAESKVHGIGLDDVHFHEVGALDAIADVVGVCAALDELGIDEVHADTVAVGSGTVQTQHGLLPVPPPAVVELLAGTGATVMAGPVARELCTPTGAALLTAQVRTWGPPPPARVLGAGTGAGTADHPQAPNVVRVLLLEPQSAARTPGTLTAEVVVSANVDDLDPRVWPHVLDRLLEAGAQDAWLTPILMKKGRPAHQVSALCSPAVVDLVKACLFRETSTIGVRSHHVDKQAMHRTERTLSVAGQQVRVKESWLDGEVVNVQPEHDDLVAAARATGMSLRHVLRVAGRELDSRVTDDLW